MKLVDLISILGVGYEVEILNTGEVVDTSYVMRHGISENLENKDFQLMLITEPDTKRIRVDLYDSDLPRGAITVKELLSSILLFLSRDKLCIVDESYYRKTLWIGSFQDYTNNNKLSIDKKEKLLIDSSNVSSFAFDEKYIQVSVNNVTYD